MEIPILVLKPYLRETFYTYIHYFNQQSDSPETHTSI